MYYKNFTEFHNEQEASKWPIDYFGSWMNDIQVNNKSNIAKLLYGYTGNMNHLYNQLLRGLGEFDKSEVNKYNKEIDLIEKEVSQFELHDNIVIYRYTYKNFFRSLFELSNMQTGRILIEKGFMSTTLLPDLMRDFAKSRNYNCILKLYLPKGTKGAYVSFGEYKLNEYEFLLPPNATFKLLAKSFSIKYRMPMYKCILINQWEFYNNKY